MTCLAMPVVIVFMNALQVDAPAFLDNTVGQGLMPSNTEALLHQAGTLQTSEATVSI